MHIHELSDWPRFTWNWERLAVDLALVRYGQGRLVGQMQALGADLRQEALLQTLTADVLNSAAISDEPIDAAEARSALAQRLGIAIGGSTPSGRDVGGIVDLVVDATRHCDQPLTANRLVAWHTSLFSSVLPVAHGGGTTIPVRGWRKEHAHAQAPSAARLDREMTMFLEWFNSSASGDPVINAGLAHLWFVTIHPFDEGNGRIARAITDMALARDGGNSPRFYSMSAQIAQERSAYRDALERAESGALDITAWMVWFVACLGRAIDGAHTRLDTALSKARLRAAVAGVALSARQRRVLNRVLDEVDGRLTTSKYAALADCSHDTALRDILQLVEQGVLVRNIEGGRSTSYALPASHL